ncbi:MAG: hypothetical protein JSS98_00380 [Bacteroidetes bacterium]|nr:hypothetical protein [Bacteroidota bacterium]
MKIWIFPLLFCCISASAQQVDSIMSHYANNYGVEKIYVHFDKTAYVPGDTIWFKCYLIKDLLPAANAKTLYMDWSDINGRLIYRTTSPIVEGTTYGQYAIPDSLKGNALHVKAYTKWMLNFDSSVIYNKSIHILSAKRSQITTKIIPSITFFPEGGNIITGVNNKIAFKANDQYGNPIPIKGIVQSELGFKDSLKVLHDGMGYFFITPKPGEGFTAKWRDDKGIMHSTPLPVATNAGVALQVGNEKLRSFLVLSNAENDSLHIIGTMFNEPVFKIYRRIKNGKITGLIPTDNLPSGILTITVFNQQWQPLAERITFVNNGDYLFEPGFDVQHWGLNKRAKNEIEISVPDSLVANLSISVTDAAIENDSSDNIISHLLLSSELKGKVYNPAFYFRNNEDSAGAFLDLVMLTNGWRRYNWGNLLNGKYPDIKYPADTTYKALSGKIYGASPTQLRNAGAIILIISQGKGNTQFTTVPVDGAGAFIDPNLIIFDTAKIYYQLPKVKDKDITVQFQQNTLPALPYQIKALPAFDNGDTSGLARHFQLSMDARNELNLYKGKVLQTVTIEKKTKTPIQIMDEKYTSGFFSGGDSYQFDMVNDPFAKSAYSIFNFLQGKIAGLQVLTTTNPPSLDWRGGAPLIYLDEIQSSVDMVADIPVSDIAYIKVMRPPFMGGAGGSSGAIAIYTRKGSDKQVEKGKGLSSNTIIGYSPIKQFYSPDYETFDPEFDKTDLRTTLLWKPEVMTRPGNSKVVLKFFNNDVAHSFRVIIEGMTTDGRLAHIERIME